MKKFLVAFIYLIGIWTNAAACDVCGCSSGASYMGTMPQIQRSFIGLRYNWRSFLVTPNDGSSLIKEHYQSSDLWVRYFPHQRGQLLAVVPLNFYSRVSTDKAIKTQGLGDISLMAGYMLYNNGDSIGKLWKHTLTINAGVKIPTGAYNMRAEGLRLTPNMQAGSGSFDYLANLFYSIRYKKVGFTTEANARFCSTNPNQYKQGDKYSAAARFFVWQRLNFNSSILPSAGLTIDYSKKDREYNQIITESGGYGLFAAVGVEYYYRRFALGANCQIPLQYSYSNNMSKPYPRLSAQLMFMF